MRLLLLRGLVRLLRALGLVVVGVAGCRLYALIAVAVAGWRCVVNTLNGARLVVVAACHSMRGVGAEQ